MSTDMHCHLDLYPRPGLVTEESKRRGTYIPSMTIAPRAWHSISLLAKGSQRIRTAFGPHPRIMYQRLHELGLFGSSSSEIEYVGEIGFDGRQESKEHWDIRLKIFRYIPNSVNRVGDRIMTIHSRGSVSAVLDEIKNINEVAVLHWLTGVPKWLERAADLGCWFSVGPAMLDTIKGKALVLKILKSCILIETDRSFAKFRNDPLMPWDNGIVEKQLAALRGVSQIKVSAQLTDNFKVLCTS